ncbi:MAG: hypothetical protein AAGA87_16520 [Pseudomonadota bacterium]
MTQTDDGEDCVSKKPWGEVLNRSLKLATFNFAKEGGASLGRIVFYVVLGLLALAAVTFVIDQITGWFDFWPFNIGADDPEGADKGWFNREPKPPADPQGGGKWYCGKLNPFCD